MTLTVHIRDPRWSLLTLCGTCIVGNAWTRSATVANCRGCLAVERRCEQLQAAAVVVPAKLPRYQGVWLRCRPQDGGCGKHTQRSAESSSECSRCGGEMHVCERTTPVQRLPRRRGPRGRLTRCRGCSGLFWSKRGHECVKQELPLRRAV